MAFVGAFAAVLVALATAKVAEDKGRSALLWFVAGLAFPLIALIVVALLGSKDNEMVPSVGDAVRSSEVAKALQASPDLSAHSLAEQVGPDEREVVRQLSALRELGFARRDDSGRWSLTQAADEQLRHGSGS